MAGVESDSPVIDAPPIDPQSNTNHERNYDGVCKESIYQYGLHYTTKEIVLLGGGDEEIGLIMIADSILAEIEMDDEIDPLRPYNDDINELVENANKH